MMKVTGGKQAMSQLLGYVRQDDAAFAASLNRVLLGTLRKDHKWDQVAQRTDVVQYLRLLEKVRQRLGSTIELDPKSREARKRFQALGDVLGYKVKYKRKTYELVPKEGDPEAFARRVAQALGWNLQRIAAELSAGEGRVLEIRDDLVPLPLTEAELTALAGAAVAPDDALELLAKDQRLGLMIAGLGQVTPETRSVLAQVDLRWIYKAAAVQLYRYGASLEVHGGALAVPGGDAAIPIWESLAGESPRRADAFIRRLLVRGNGRVAFLWKAMRFAPPNVAKYYLGTGSAAASEDQRFVRRLFRRLDNAAMRDFDSPSDEEWGFPALVRSIPVDSNGASFRLPGGGGLWYVAAKGNDLPANRAALRRMVDQGGQAALEDGDFLLRSLTESVDVGGYQRPILPRLIRSVHVVESAELLTAENVIAATRAVDNYPAALSLLHSFPFADPETIVSYLLAVVNLDRQGGSVAAELSLTLFQGGVEWLGLTAQAARVDAAWLEDHLKRWSTLYQELDDPFDDAPKILAWLESFLTGLPEAAADAPGRGPLEAAWIQAMIGPRDPQEFEWAGLDYEGRRGAELARAMAVNLEKQGIPSVDQLLELAGRLRELGQAARSQDLDGVHRLAGDLLGELRALPEVRMPALDKNEALRQRMLPVDRGEIAEILEKLRNQSKAKRLERQADSAARAERLLARELRQVLLAPIYLAAMADQENILFDDPNLVRKHLLSENLNAGAHGENRWRRGNVRMIAGVEAGSQVIGHVSSVPFALTEFIAGSSQQAQAGGLDTLLRDKAWHEDLLTTPWHRAPPQLSRLVALLVDAGGEAADAAVESLRQGGAGDPVEFVATRIPRARLAAFAHAPEVEPGVSPSERLLLGLALLAGDDPGPPRGDLVAPPVGQRFDELKAELGPDWRRQLDVVAAATPGMNGRSRRWVGHWPPYEALDRQNVYYALWERELLDLRVWLFAHLGRHGLPGEMGADILRMLLSDLAADLKLESLRDWHSHLRWVNGRDAAYFEEKVRTCLASGLYSLRSF